MKYYAEIVESEGIYRVSFPDLPEVSTYGDSIEDALINGAEALTERLGEYIKAGEELPSPACQYKGDLYPVRVDPDLIRAQST